MHTGIDGKHYMSGRDVREMRERLFDAFSFPPPNPPSPPPPPIQPPSDGEHMNNNSNDQGAFIIGLFFILTVLGVILALMFGLPKYNVWRSELQGRAEFVRAEQNRMIMIEEAKANLEAEKLNAQAEIERAKGAAAAIEIEGGKLTDAYLRYLWIRQLKTDNSTLIYVPTEAGLPILEAGRMTKTQTR